MPRNPYPAAWPTGSRVAVREYPLKSGETFLKGALVKLTAGEVEESGADPAGVLGLAQHDAADTLITGKVLVDLADFVSEFNWPVSGSLSAANVGINYGVVKTSDVWYIDLTETTADVVTITRLDPLDSARAYARFCQTTVVLHG